MDLMQLATLVGVVAAIVWVTLPFVYLATAPEFYKTTVGRALMYLLGSTAAMFALLLTVRLFGIYPARPFVHAAVYATVMAAGVRLAVLFVKLRIELERALRNEKALLNSETQEAQ